LTGLENLTSIGGYLWITNNYLLSSCDAEWLCNYLSNPNGSIDIYYNSPGCKNPPEIASYCGFAMPCLPFGNYNFTQQAEIDNFQNDYQGCTEIEGNVSVLGQFINNLNGLNVVTSIGGNLRVMGTSDLINLSGLENLTSIEGRLDIWNNALTSFYGIESLNSIGSYLYIIGNYSLNSLSGLESLTSIDGELEIASNDALTSLLGLENIDAESISDLYIYYNGALSTCDVQSICDYLAAPNGTIEIYYNDPGCNTPEEVQEHCLTGNDEQKIENGLTIIPNPSNNKIIISSSAITGNTLLSIFTVSGEKVIERQLTDTETQIDISALSRGVYFVRVQDEKMVEVGKIIKQ